MRKFNNFFNCFLLLLSLAFMIGCEHSSTSESILKAQYLMENHPDSAMEILKSIPTTKIKKEKNQAMFGLLYTQAMDKNWLNPKNDSLISLSVDYFSNNGKPLYQTESYYYQGRVRFHLKDYPRSILSYVKAKEIAKANNLDFWVAMSNRGIADIYNTTYNRAEELHYTEDEFKYFQKSGVQPYLNYALNDLGVALCNSGKTEESLKISQMLTDSAKKYEDDLLLFYAKRLEVNNLINNKKYEQALNISIDICKNEEASISDTINLCNIFIELGRIQEVSEIIPLLSDSNTIHKLNLQYLIDRKRQNYQGALEKFEKIDSISETILKNSLNHNLTSSLIDYFEFQRERDELEIKEERLKKCIYITIALIVLVIVIILSIYLIRRQNHKISEKVLLAEQLSDSLKKSESNNARFSETIKWLTSTKFELLENLCKIAYENNDETSRRRRVADAVDNLISELSKQSYMIKKLEKEANILYNNIYTEFVEDFPKLKDADYRLFLFLIMGLEMPTITLLLNEKKIEAVYNRKRRLKVKISRLENDKTQKYLEFFT